MTGLGSLVSGLSGVASSGLGLLGNDDAEDANMQAIAAAKGDVNNGYTQAQGLESPIYQQGISSLGSLADKYNSGGYANPTSTAFQGTTFDPSKISSDPQYQAELAQGTAAIDGSTEAQGGLFSGNTDRALQSFGENTAAEQENNLEQQNLQNNEFGAQNQQTAYTNNANNNATQFQEGAGLAGNAQTGASTLGSLYTQQGSDLGNLDLGQGNVRSGGILNATGLLQSGTQGLGNTIGGQLNLGGSSGGYDPSSTGANGPTSAGSGDTLGSLTSLLQGLSPEELASIGLA